MKHNRHSRRFFAFFTAVVLLAAPRMSVTASSNQTTSKSAPAVENISIIDSPTGSQVIVTARGARHSNYFLLRGPDKNDLPAVVLDIYGVTLPRNAAIGSVKSEKGAFTGASARLLREKPEPVVRIIAHMREARQYRVQKEGSDRWNIIIQRETPIVVYQPPEYEAPETDELKPQVLAVPVSELPEEMKPIEPPTVVPPPAVPAPQKRIAVQKTQDPLNYTSRTPLEQSLPWASLAALILLIAISI